MNNNAFARLFRRPGFWLVFAVVSALCALVAYRLFPRVFPVVSLDIRLDRSHAIEAARSFVTAQKLGPPDAGREVASFEGDPAQAFIELEGGGKSAFAALLEDDLYSPYAWRVRIFKESETNQTVVRFRPDGRVFDFEETLRQQAPGAALTPDEAREIAETSARRAPWVLPLDRFTRVETSKVVRPGGRVDHTFVYERPDRLLGEGRLRMQLVVSGNRLTALRHFVKVPEAFNRRYEQMRSANNGIAAGGGIALVLLYVLGGCLGGFLFLMRQRAVLWRQPLLCAAVVAGLQLAAGLNAWPLEWLKYDTALSAGGFITERLLALGTGVLVLGLVFFLSFLAAEGLSRRAFPDHPQFWRLWSREAAPSLALLGRTLAGYLLAAVALVYVVAFYFFAIRKLGWWSPSEALVDPNSLAHYWPWLTPLATATQAAVWEETLFRAVPLAGAALLGNRFGGRKWWIAGAFLLQAVVFAAGHANYPGQPAYSRLVELIVPAFVFGGLYLRFGLLPAIILHFVYDAVLMSLPIFAASAAGLWLDRGIVILFVLLPLWVVLVARWRSGRWTELPAALRNGAWQPPALSPDATATTTPFAAPSAVSEKLLRAVLVAGLVGFAAWVGATHFSGLGAPLQIDRAEAIQSAQAELSRRGVKLPATAQAFATVARRLESSDRFVWQTAGRRGYEALLGRYVPEARWVVRFARFDGDVAERAEEWTVYLRGDGQVGRYSHRLPEARAGATLSEADARARVHALLQEKWRLAPGDVREVSATSAKRPARTDWTFVFKDPAEKSLAPGEARLRVDLAGEEVADTGRFVFVPENWERADRALQSKFKTGAIAKGVTIGGLFLTGVGLALVAWSRKKLAARFGLELFGLLFAAILLTFANRWPAMLAGFSTSQPLALQKTMAVVGGLVGGLVLAAGVALLVALVARWLRPSPVDERRALVLGGGTGLAVAGGVALTALGGAGAGPIWPAAGSAENYVPWLSPALGAILPFFTRTAALLFVFAALDRATAGWQRQRPAAVVLAFVSCTVLQLSSDAPSVGLWLGSALAAGVVVVIFYVLVLRHDLSVLPWAVGVSGALTAVAAGLPRHYPGALPSAVLAAAVWLALGWWTTRTLRALAAAHAAEHIAATP